MTSCDIVLVGVGGQGVVTLGDLIARAALAAAIPMTYVPTKGMAQRGGFVKVEIRLGREAAGPRIGPRGADVVVAMERSEALKALPFVQPDGQFILYDHVWEPTGVMLGEDDYPPQEPVLAALSEASGHVLVLNPADRPAMGDRAAAANIFTLGALFSAAAVTALIAPSLMEQVLADRWPRVAESNLLAFRAGFMKGNSPHGEFLGSSPSGELLLDGETHVLG